MIPWLKKNQMLDRVVHGDVITILDQIPKESIDLCVTSPPYNIGMDYGGIDDEIPWDVYYDWCKEWLNSLFEVMKPDGRVAINHYFSMGNTKRGKTYPLMKINEMAIEMGYKHHAVTFWMDRTLSRRTAWGSWLSASSPYINSPLEGILLLYKDQWKKLKKGTSTIDKEEFMMGCGGLWEIPTERKIKDHPAPFPEALARMCINLLSYEGDVVLDPFVGSGTTCVVAKKSNRHYLGIDLNQDYVDLAENRLEEV